ncbi:hypothetical protein, partial [Pectobacterium brasiliense]|uniref:hypothetical protein n=1 Tax=Pectobacterium brasiliense TaxID=180957 RepID=UPI001F2F27D7
PMPNSEVKRRSADGSVGLPHVRVGNCQASNKIKGSVERLGLFAMGNFGVICNELLTVVDLLLCIRQIT